jgi:hypothetical protein
MTLSFKVPSFISEYFNGYDHNGKEEVVKRYKSWYESDFTQLLLADIEKQHKLLVEQDEKKSDFASWFQLSYITARNRAKRSLLKELIKKLDYKV